MVLFGAYDTAERFVDDNRLTGHFPGPGSYTFKSSVEGSPTPRYARSLVEDGVVRPDGSEVMFRERDCWVRGDVGPKVGQPDNGGDSSVRALVYDVAKSSIRSSCKCRELNRSLVASRKCMIHVMGENGV